MGEVTAPFGRAPPEGAAACASATGALVAEGAALDMQTNKGGATALIIASYQGHTQIVAALLAAGANTEVQLRNGKTAIDFSKNADILNMLRAAAKP